VVIVVPSRDLENATKAFPDAASKRIKIVGEEDVLDSGHMQQKLVPKVDWVSVSSTDTS
jgi:hypothetical protein